MLLLPDPVFWRQVLSRRDPDPVAVAQFMVLLQARRLVILPQVLQAVLAQAVDKRQFARLARCLEAFPQVCLSSAEHIRAAELQMQLTAQSLRLGPTEALIWAAAERRGLQILGRDPVWAGLRDWLPPLLAGDPTQVFGLRRGGDE